MAKLLEEINQNVAGGTAGLNTSMPVVEAAPVDSFIKKIKSTISKQFPKSALNVVFSTNIKPGIHISFAVGKKGQWVNNISHNDISLTKAFIYGMDKEGALPDRMEFSPAMGGSIMIKPAEGSFYAFDTIKVGLRKKTGTPDQIIKHLDTYFKKLKKTLVDNRDKIPAEHYKLIKKNF